MSNSPLPPVAPTGSTAAGNGAVGPTIWVAHCPFRKTGSPVLGTFGRTTRPVVVMTLATWKALCEEVPALAAKQFNVGTFEE